MHFPAGSVTSVTSSGEEKRMLRATTLASAPADDLSPVRALTKRERAT